MEASNSVSLEHLGPVLHIGTVQCGPSDSAGRNQKYLQLCVHLIKHFNVAAWDTVKAAKCSASSSVCKFKIMHVILFDKWSKEEKERALLVAFILSFLKYFRVQGPLLFFFVLTEPEMSCCYWC